MSIQATSLEAYKEVKKTLSFRQNVVFNILKFNIVSMTNSELADRLKWSINRVTGRTNELVKKDLVKEDCKRRCSITGRIVIAWRIKRPDEITERQEELFSS